ncbi:hypothetical protein DAPPUDRAFT_113921 [Daphnia pulex]|uniref:SBNO alpha/beta domain-containing protein n=1 Tax=Daphnia pulex TaxID=6669 RepID=E9HGI1_DAPPU|nr:hypothetical protein DAPPUDRAFT_113921 [Daphnia pulex]|eukprot:EFX69166.1 hypothetical protein DAPPUDRAFT_113921 [Daphnia pulex]
MSWKAVEEKSSGSGPKEVQLLVAADDEANLDKWKSNYRIFRPNTGLQEIRLSLAQLKKDFKQIDYEKAKPIWKEKFTSSATKSGLVRWLTNGKCPMPVGCELGLRVRKFHILSGPIRSNTVSSSGHIPTRLAASQPSSSGHIPTRLAASQPSSSGHITTRITASKPSSSGHITTIITAFQPTYGAKHRPNTLQSGYCVKHGNVKHS